jgi:hypothetical protein
MKKTLLSLLLLAISFNCKSQDKYPFSWDGKSFIDSLRLNGVTSIVSFKEYFPGAEILFDQPELTCESENYYYELYIVWQEKGVNKLKKFNNCFEFSTQQFDNNQLFEFIAKNGQVIKMESQQIEKRKNGYALVHVSHSNRIDLNVYSENSHDNYYVDETVAKLNESIYVDFEKTKLFKLISLMKDFTKLEFEKAE